MQLLSFLSLAAAFALVTVGQVELPPQPGLKLDQTADWYKDHGMPVPDVAPEITVIEANKSYVVKLDCPSCPFTIKDGEMVQMRRIDNSLRCEPSLTKKKLLKFDIKKAESALSTVSLNGGQILPLAPMPLFINAYQVLANTSQNALDSIVHEGMLDPNYAGPTPYYHYPVMYDHTLLKTKDAGQWWLQFYVTGLHSHFSEYTRLVEILIKEQKGESGAVHSLSIEDFRVVGYLEREKPLKMKCGRLAMVKTSFKPSEWDEYGKLGSWSHTWNMVIGKIGQGLDHIRHSALLLPLALFVAFIVFFARVGCQRRQQDKNVDAEYALVDTEDFELPPAYSDIPVIKIEEYD
ncbi:hypothetical protein SVAN01_07516 [Stagonosporopsis vannaccii]|nr:hypothetical protein SVAN01_07516 [Stagonosporopsis vannaccii]